MDFRDANLRGILDECQTDLEIVWRESGWEQPGDNAAASLEAPQARLQELLRSVASRLGHISNLVEAVLRLEEMDAADKVETLALEADHRIGNNLQMLVSILNRQAGQARTIDGREAYGHAASQVSAVAPCTASCMDRQRRSPPRTVRSTWRPTWRVWRITLPRPAAWITRTVR